MRRATNLHKVRNWIFERFAGFLMHGDWELKIRNFKKAKKKSERNLTGLCDFEKKAIYLDVDNALPLVLAHELCHAFFQDFLEDEARNQPKRNIKRLKGTRKFDRWVELRVYEWERCFIKSLSKDQIEILQFIIDQAKNKKA